MPAKGNPETRRTLIRMLILCFVLQILAIGVFHQYRVREGNDNYGFGWEMGRIARSLATGKGFSNPYGGSTGPTAFEPPLYPYLMGGVFKVFGIYSPASAWVMLAFNSLFNALTCIPIFFIARRMLGERLALWSAWIWALFPYAMYWSIHWIWDTTFSPFILACIFWLSFELKDSKGWQGWATFGVLWALLVLSNPSMILFLPFCGLWIWYRRSRTGHASLGGVTLASLIFILCMSPWLVRNYKTFGKFIFVRDDFGLQLRLGNGPFADGMLMPYLPPSFNQLEFREYQRLGEVAYAERCKRMALGWIRENPGRFVVVSLKRVFYYWNGVPKETNSASLVDFRTSFFLASSVLALWGLRRALRKKLPGAWLFLGLIITYPTIYYFVFPHARYRHPIEPELLILAVFLVSEIGKKANSSPTEQQ